MVSLYKQHVSPHVKEADLFRNGQYIVRNRWNNSTTAGAMHLIQQNNTLGAEIELAAAATIVRQVGGQLVTDSQTLINCGAYGQPERHSDPNIGAAVNELARKKADITLENPVGLYIAGLSVAGWATPDGSNPLDCWSIQRGTPEKALRAVPKYLTRNRSWSVTSPSAGAEIEFGAQVADFITIKLTGVATRIGESTVTPLTACVTSVAPGLEAVAAMPSVAEAISRRPRTGR